ncbi:MAG TPA: hypothetical protein PK794_04395, partial [Armatimonadota bacterium]|nr:hypothetical protein [Armatimonadota bacterium]
IQAETSAARVTVGPYALDAQTIRVNLAAGDLTAEGEVVMTGPDGVFTADSLRYNMETEAGHLDRVMGCFAPFRFAAQSMSLDAQGTKQIQRARLTTCARAHPHYELRARSFVVQDSGQFRARHTALAMAGHRIVNIPSIRGKVGGGGAEIAQPALTGGVSGIDGTYLAVNYAAPVGDDRDLRITGRAGTEGLFRGHASYTQPFAVRDTLTDGTVALHVSVKEDVENRLVAGDRLVDERLERLTISRLPALQVAFPALPLRGELEGYALRVGGGLGRYREEPTDVTANRAQAWAVLTSPAVQVGGNLRLRGELGLRGAVSGGQQHGTSVLQLTLDTPPEKAGYVNLSYLRRRESGTSPFLFDRVAMPDELYTEYEFPLGKDSPWWLNVANRLDLETLKSRDYSVTAIYKLDCISYGLTYNYAAKSVGVGLVLNAFGSFHKGVGGVGFSQ